MTWWLKVRTAPGLLAALGGTMLLGLLIGDAELPVPALTGQSGRFLLGHLLTLTPAVVFLFGTGRGDTASESVAIRPVRRWDVALALTTAALALAAAGVVHTLAPDSIALTLGRNTTGYLGLALLLYPFLGHRLAGAAICAVPLICAGAGWAQGGQPEPWAWILYPPNSAPALTAALTILATGTIAALTWQRQPWNPQAAR
ncbi:hypothetical protein ABT160_31170 [Streptomyces sp. NPDC001941]|uniref:hypothetical protein n=1 Tax=Streptomyces sp. NPDC001941 TaxID=3154659 RepID=UPI00331AF206